MNSPAYTQPQVATAAPSAATAPAASAPVSHLPSIESSALLQGARTIHILHNGETYRLQTTRQGKLILTK